MKKIIFLLTMLFTFSIFANSICTEEDLKLATSFLQSVEKKYNAGLTVKSDLAIAKLSGLEMKFCSGQVDKETYCAEKKSKIEEILLAVKARFNSGISSASEYAETLEMLIDFRKTCE